jgi:hypothetical protein
MLRHQHYALSWNFESKEDIDNTALFSLLINRHNIKAKEVINKYKSDNRKIDFETALSFSRVEWLPSASREMTQLLLDSFPDNDDINYVATSWSIMSNYDIPNLKYAHDHDLVYKSVGKEIPKHKYGIKICRETRGIKISESDDGIHGDNIINVGTKKRFDKIWDKPDIYSIYDCINDTDYDWMMRTFKFDNPNYELEECD